MRPRILPMLPVVVAMLPSPYGHGQAMRAEPAPQPSGAPPFPSPLMEAIRREAESRKREIEATFAKTRAAMARLTVDPRAFQDWSTRIRPVLRVEYQFLRTTCNPTRERRMPIALAGLVALDDAATKCTRWQTGRNQDVRVVNGRFVDPAGLKEAPDPRKIIQGALLEAAKELLPPEQHERYRRELEARSDYQRQALLTSLVVKLDDLLHLTVEQRDAIHHSLSARRDDSLCALIRVASVDSQAYPLIPDEDLVSVLNDDQKTVWARTVKFQRVPDIDLDTTGLEDGPLDDEFPDEAVTRPETGK